MVERWLRRVRGEAPCCDRARCCSTAATERFGAVAPLVRRTIVESAMRLVTVVACDLQAGTRVRERQKRMRLRRQCALGAREQLSLLDTCTGTATSVYTRANKTQPARLTCDPIDDNCTHWFCIAAARAKQTRKRAAGTMTAFVALYRAHLPLIRPTTHRAVRDRSARAGVCVCGLPGG